MSIILYYYFNTFTEYSTILAEFFFVFVYPTSVTASRQNFNLNSVIYFSRFIKQNRSNLVKFNSSMLYEFTSHMFLSRLKTACNATQCNATQHVSRETI